MKAIILLIVFILFFKVAIVVIFNKMDIKDEKGRDLIVVPKGLNTVAIGVEE